MRTLRVLVIGLAAFSVVSATGSAAVPPPNPGGPDFRRALGSLPGSPHSGRARVIVALQRTTIRIIPFASEHRARHSCDS